MLNPSRFWLIGFSNVHTDNGARLQEYDNGQHAEWQGRRQGELGMGNHGGEAEGKRACGH